MAKIKPENKPEKSAKLVKPAKEPKSKPEKKGTPKRKPKPNGKWSNVRRNTHDVNVSLALREQKMASFLRAYKSCGLIKEASNIACMDYRTLMKWRKEFPAFDEEVELVKSEVWLEKIEALETALFKRAVEGYTNPSANGPVVSYSDTVGMFLLKRLDPSYRESATQVNVANSLAANTNTGNVTVIQDPDWYGNDAHDLATKAITAHAPSATLTSEVQISGLREEME